MSGKGKSGTGTKNKDKQPLFSERSSSSTTSLNEDASYVPDKDNTDDSAVHTEFNEFKRDLLNIKNELAECTAKINQIYNSADAATSESTQTLDTDIYLLGSNSVKLSFQFKQAFISGAKGSYYLLCLGFLISLSRDMRNTLKYPEDTYGYGIFDLLMGIAKEEMVFTPHLGHVMYGRDPFLFWFGVPLVAAIPFVVGGLYTALRARKSHHFIHDVTKLIKDLQHVERDGCHNNFVSNFLQGLSPFSAFSIRLGQLEEFVLSEDKNKLKEARFKALEAIINIAGANQYGFFKRLRALNTLAKIANANKNAKLIAEVAKIENIENFSDVYAELQQVCNTIQLDEQLNQLSQLFAWHAGVADKKRSQLLWMPFTLFTLGITYPPTYLAMVFTRKLLETIAHNQADETCKAEHGEYVYREEAGQHECTVCGRWPFVKEKDVFAAQSCLESLLAQNMTPKEMAEHILEFKIPRNFTQLDLSQYAWRDWTFEELDLFLTKVEQFFSPHIKTINLSSTEINELPPPAAHMQRITQFLQKIYPEQIDMRNQGLGSADILPILQAATNTTVKYINLSGNLFGDTGAEHVAVFISHVSVEELILQNTGMSCVGVSLIAQANSTVSRLVLTGSEVDSSALIALANATIHQNLKEIVLGDVPVPVDGLKQFCSRVALPASKLRSLTLNKISNFSDRHAAALAPCMNKLSSLEVPNNPGLTERGAAIILKSAENGTLSDINFAFCNIRNTTLAAERIPATLRKINLSGNPSQAYYETLLILGNRNVTEIIITDVPHGDAIGAAFNKAFSYANCSTPVAVDFSRTSMTVIGAENTLNTTCLGGVNLSDNNLLGIGSFLVNVAKSNQQLTTIIVKNAQIEGQDIQLLASVLRYSAIKKLIVTDNPRIGSEAGLALAKACVKPVVHEEQLGMFPIISDQAKVFRQDLRAQTQLEEFEAANAGFNQSVIVAFERLEIGIGLNVQISGMPQTNTPHSADYLILNSSLMHQTSNNFIHAVKFQAQQNTINFSWIDMAHQTVAYGSASSFATVITTNVLQAYRFNTVSVEVLSKLPQLGMSLYCGGNLYFFVASQLVEFALRSTGVTREKSQQAGTGISLVVNLAKNINQYGYFLGTGYTLTTMTVTYASSVLGTCSAKIVSAVAKPLYSHASSWVADKLSFWKSSTNKTEDLPSDLSMCLHLQDSHKSPTLTC